MSQKVVLYSGIRINFVNWHFSFHSFYLLCNSFYEIATLTEGAMTENIPPLPNPLPPRGEGVRRKIFTSLFPMLDLSVLGLLSFYE
ncbi:MAG: hypothetical protein U9N03_02075 [Candidatus Caldatribacteriota bacterium]|nr:hypothetical protein [Candidatus Caldatribacteriota bacterium]